MCDPDCVKIMALGRQFTIGSLYNYAEDVIVPNLRLWDPKDTTKSVDVKNEIKKTVNIHSMATDDDEVEHEPWLSKLEVDDHTAMSLMTGMLRPSEGAWQYAANWADPKAQTSDRRAEVAVHCRCSSKEVSVVDSTSQMEIIIEQEKLNKRRATHVVVAITYGLEALCIFSQQKKQLHNMRTDDETGITRTQNYAHVFAKRLENNIIRINQDKEGDEEDGGHCSIPLDLKCTLYSDLSKQVMGGGQSWTFKSVGEQYEACRAILDHQADKALPLEVIIYPLHKLISDRKGKNNIPIIVDLSPNLVFRCQMLWDRLQETCWDKNSLIGDLRDFYPSTTSKEIKDFAELITKFVGVLLKDLAELTVSVRLGTLDEKKIKYRVNEEETNSPFLSNELNCWLIKQKKQIQIFKRLGQLPGVLPVCGVENLKKVLKNSINGSYAVVLHLPISTRKSDPIIAAMKNYVGVVNLNSTYSWKNWTRGGSKRPKITESTTSSMNCHQIFEAGQKFSKWVTENNSDILNVRYFIFYNEQKGETLPFMKLYDCRTGMELSNFTIPKAPGPVEVVNNHRGVITLSWTTEEEVEQPNFLLQYRSIDRSGDVWDSIQHNSKKITISYLQLEETYEFRVATVTKVGRSPFSQVSCEVTIDSGCPSPSGLRCKYATNTSIVISWDHQLNSAGCVETIEEEAEYLSSNQEAKVKIVSYSIDCWISDRTDESTFIRRSTTEKLITLEPLVPNTAYCVQVRAVCTDGKSYTFNSKNSKILRTKTRREAERAATIVRSVSEKCSKGIGIDVYKLPVKKNRRTQTQGVRHYVFGESSYLANKRHKRTILMLGATGSGKSTLINAMVNYVLGVEWDDDFRFKLIDEPADKSQAHSQTDLVTTYDFHEMKGSRLNYSLTVVDTPGFGDTRGLEKDKKIMQQIKDYFQCRHGIQQLEAVCFVVQSSLARLTITQQYIFDSILSIFGQDIKDNIRLMVTFADNAEPPVLEAVKEAGIPSPTDPATGLPLYHKFNNSIFFTTNKGGRQTNEFNQIYFEMAVEGFDKFFDDLSRMEPKSLTLTREVLEERKRLEALVEGLQLRTQIKLTRIDEFQQIKKILTDNKDQIEANKNFEFEVEFLVRKATDISRTGQFTTNCENCRTTCHFPCRQAHDEDKHLCSVMDRSGNCKICKCAWNNHFNQKFRYEMVKEKVKRSSDDIRQQYQEATNEAMTNEQLLDRIQKEIKQYETQLLELMEATHPCIKRLDEIALRPHPFSTPGYIELMIAAEKQENRAGYQQRIATLYKLRGMAEITSNLVRNHSQSTESLQLRPKRSTPKENSGTNRLSALFSGVSRTTTNDNVNQSQSNQSLQLRPKQPPPTENSIIIGINRLSKIWGNISGSLSNLYAPANDSS